MNLHLNITQDIGHGVTIIFICCVLTAMVVLFDLYTGIRAARKTGEPIRSHILRRTITKIIDYYFVIFFAVLIDILGLFFPWYGIPYAVIIATLAVLVIEGRSMLENLAKAKSHASEIDDVVLKSLPILKEMIDCKSVKSAIKLYEEIKKGKDDDKE